MAWNMNAGSKAKSAKSQGFVKEGNVEVLLFTETPTKVRFLTEDVDVEELMAAEKLTREEAQEKISTEIMFDKWIQPIGMWEHSWKPIPGVRFFGTQVCPGRATCKMCAANKEAEAQGVTENKLKPYPVRKRFFVPIWSYEFNRVLFLKQSQEFFEDIAQYLGRQDGPVDFEVYKTGKGLNTKYKSTFIGPSENKETIEVPIAPGDLDFSDGGDLPGNGAGQTAAPAPAQAPEPKPEPSGDAGSFVIPFGTHKGQTIQAVADTNPDYLQFLAENSSGLIKDKVDQFLVAQG